MNLFKFFKRKPVEEEKVVKKFPFLSNIRKDSDNMSDKEKMDKGFNGDTYSINGRDVDF